MPVVPARIRYLHSTAAGIDLLMETLPHIIAIEPARPMQSSNRTKHSALGESNADIELENIHFTLRNSSSEKRSLEDLTRAVR